MARARKRTTSTRATKPRTATTKKAPSPFQRAKGEAKEPDEHVYGTGVVCETDKRGHATPRGRSRFEIVVDASEGFIPLWVKQTTLRWRFRESSFRGFANPSAAKAAIRRLMAEAILAWDDAAPVKFAENAEPWDFEVVMRRTDNCNANGCVLASAFFPDAGRHALTIYPRMLTQSRQEQIETLVHELGHAFGLRHFFANVSETAWPSRIFGTHRPFSIMNYGSQSVLTADDKADLRRLYRMAWSGELTAIGGTPIRLVRPYHAAGTPPQAAVIAVGTMPPAVEPLPRAAFVDGD